MTMYKIETEEQHEHDVFLAGPELVALTWNWEQMLRGRTKHGNGESVSWDTVREIWYELKKDHELPESLWQ